MTDTSSPDLTPGVPIVFTDGTKRAEIASTATKAALTVLMERWPCAIDFNELCDLATARAAAFPASVDGDQRRQSMIDDLFGGVMYGLIGVHTHPPRCTNHPSEAPRAHPVAALQARDGNLVVNAHHTMFQLDALAVEILRLADGHRRREEMLDVLVGWFESGRMTLEQDGRPVTDRHAARATLAGRLATAIDTLTRSALLEA